MISSLHIQGLKAFSRAQDVPLGRITLVFGDNSAGKSSLLQALLLLKQTLTRSIDGKLWSAGDLVDLGGFLNLAHSHDPTCSLRLGLSMSSAGESPRARSPEYSASFNFEADGARDALARGIELGWAGDGRAVAVRAEPRLDIGSRDGGPFFDLLTDDWPPPQLAPWLCEVLGPRLRCSPLWRASRDRALDAIRGGRAMQASSRVALDDTWEGFGEAEIAAALASMGTRLRPGRASRFASSSWLPRHLEGPGASEAGAADAQPGDVDIAVVAALDTVMDRTFARLLEHLERTAHVGPAREIPQRLFPLRPHGWEHQQSSDELARLVDDLGLLERVNDHLRSLAVPYHLEPARFDSADPLLEDSGALRLVDHRYAEGLLVNIADVGFGISQLLPIVVASVANPGGTVMVEQPETHVHPGLQAQLAEILVEESRSTQFVVETHSEHLMLRLLRCVRQGRLDPAELAVLYVEHAGAHNREGASGNGTSERGARVLRIDVDSAGDFVQRWPGGFFTERESELFDDLDEVAASEP
ncbi:MAG TPA: AAA family ATPase [Solirubrobacteraceae bacterium]|nr:AAA family ATPase [Solirubrobacteraceae bacterium]